MRNLDDIKELSDLDTLTVLFEDNDYVAIYKPAKLLVHRSPIDRHENKFALQILRQQLGCHLYPVHRLDKPTSGVILFAKHSKAAAQFQALLQTNNVHKEYLAIVRGQPKAQLIDHPVKAQFDKYLGKTQPARQAKTALAQLATVEIDNQIDPRYPSSRYSLIALQPLTGRRHQLRYHSKHIASPIIGDAKYGKSIHNRYFEQRLNYRRLYLSATVLKFIQPFNQQPITIQAMPDQSFINAGNLCQFDTAIDQYFCHNNQTFDHSPLRFK